MEPTKHGQSTGDAAPQGPVSAIVDAQVARCVPGQPPLERGFVAWQGERIVSVGPMSRWRDSMAQLRFDAGGALLTPGLIDCHTHLVHAGDRAREFEMRLNGAGYEEIALAGGGIVSTVRATREADEQSLHAASLARLMQLRADGVTAVEIKSGYGLDTATECRQLRVARRLGCESGTRVHATFLGAHAVPPEYAGRPDVYIDLVVGEMLPAVVAGGLADSVDAFCDRIGFSAAQVRRVFDAARAAGLPVRVHAEQLSDAGGTVLAAEFGALSADHLEYADEAAVRAMARAGMVAVLLPAAFYFLRETRLPPVQALRRDGVPIAVATDCNPGSSPCTSLTLAMNMACTLFRLTPIEALHGVTCHAARALGWHGSRGELTPGAVADLALWRVDTPSGLCYEFGGRKLERLFMAGRDVASTTAH